LPKQTHLQGIFDDNQLLIKSLENLFFGECIFYKSEFVNNTRETLDGDHFRIGCWLLVAGWLVDWMIG
jgi:hypothetical protein